MLECETNAGTSCAEITTIIAREVVTPVTENADARSQANFHADPCIGKRCAFAVENVSTTGEDIRSHTAAPQLNGITKDQVSCQLMQRFIAGTARKPIRIHADTKVAGEEETCSCAAAVFVMEIGMMASIIYGVIVGIREVNRELLILEICARSHRLFEFLGGHH